MRSKALFLCLIVLAAGGLAAQVTASAAGTTRTAVVAEATAPVVIGTVTPNGNRFIVVIDPRKIPPMFPDYGANARGRGWSVEEVKTARSLPGRGSSSRRTRSWPS